MIKISEAVKKAIAKEQFYSEETFIKDAKRYISAVKSGRINYRVTHVERSGMSRNISILSYEGTMSKGCYCNYFAMLRVMGYKQADHYSHDIKVGGCGMSMTFAVNYDLCHQMHSMGFINRKVCDVLAQKVS